MKVNFTIEMKPDNYVPDNQVDITIKCKKRDKEQVKQFIYFIKSMELSGFDFSEEV